LSQRCLRPDHDQLDAFFPGGFGQRLDISGADIQVTGDLRRAGITRGGINLFDSGAQGQLPDQGMLPGPAANNQYLQSSPLIRRLFINLTPCIPLSKD